jgi:PAS domain S-box-containing protein
MIDKLHILLVEDNPGDADLIREMLSGVGPEAFEIECVSRLSMALESVKAIRFEFVLLDLGLPDSQGLDTIRAMRGGAPDLPIVVLTGNKDEKTGLDAIKKGAQDYLVKGQLDSRLLIRSIRYAIERKQVEDSLVQMAQEWQRTFDTMHEAVWILDKDQVVLRSNKAAEGYFHRPCSEMVGKYCWEIVHGTTEPVPECPVMRARKSLHHESEELQIGDGCFDVSVDPILDADGKFAGAVHVISNITERKQVEKIQIFLAQSSSGTAKEPFFNALARYLAQSLQMDFVCIDRLEGDGLNARTVAVWCDGQFEDNVTYALKDTPCGDVVGKMVCCFPASVCQFFPRDQVLQDLRAESYVGVTLWSHAGRPIGLIAVIGRTPMANRPLAESILKVVAVRAASELERLESEDALRKSEERYAMTISAVNDGLWDWHVPSGIAFFSPLYYTILGYANGEFAATYNSWRLLVHPEDIGNAECELRKSVETGKGFSIDLRMKGKAGEWIWVSTRGRAIDLDADGKAVRMAGVLSDITDRKRLEVEKAKLEEQNWQLQKVESLGRMAGAIAHTFNNQLHVVEGYLEMVIGYLPPGDPCVAKLTTALQAARKASDVSSLMITYLGQKAVKLESLDLSELCRMSLPVFQAGKPETVTLETDLPEPGPVINADLKQIQQLLTNLVINAWEAIGEASGTIDLSVRTVAKSDIPLAHRFPLEWCPLEERYACLEVTDSGCGIHENDIYRIFDPFFSTKFTGRGLGLSVVLGIVKTHKLLITVKSGIGGGSVFSVFFPISANAVPLQSEQVAKVPEIVPGGTILLVEDEPDVRKMTASMLNSFGFTVLQAKDGVDAVEIFAQRKDEIVCLLSDLTMPRMCGWETISAIRAIRHDLPVILASGYDEASVMEGEHAEMPDFFLNKPYAMKKLGDTVCNAIARKTRPVKKG